MTATTIDLIRHGEPEGGPMYRGSTDHPLSETGWQQMREATAAKQPWDCIVTSPLLRCSEFAHELAAQHDIPISVCDDLREVGFGEWEGKTATQLEQIDQEAFMAFYDDPIMNTPPGGEPMRDFELRVLTALQKIEHEHEGKHILIVAHGGVNRVVLSYVLSMPLSSMFRITVPYACVSRVLAYPSGYTQLLFHAANL